KFEGYDNEFP
nr:Chain L, bicyclic peptide B8 [synthetic construct]7MP3_N Chain N, bicyclic peptide B8 [synthetic construct]